MGFEKVGLTLAKYAEKCGLKSILQTKPIAPAEIKAVFSSADLKLKPLITDTFERTAKKPTASEVKIFNDNLLNRISDKIFSKGENLQQLIYKEINPINHQNYNGIKLRMEDLFKNTELEDKIKNCKSPDELFLALKQNSTNVLCQDLTKFIEQTKLEELSISKSLKYLEIRDAVSKKIAKFIDIATPKSINPEVVKIENNLKNMGINNINLSDDLSQAKLIEEAMCDFKKEGLPLPNSIIVSPLLSNSTHLGMNSFGMKSIYLTTSKEQSLVSPDSSLKLIKEIINEDNEFKNATPALRNSSIEDLENMFSNQFSTKNPKHIIYHETAHTFIQDTLENELRTIPENKFEMLSHLSTYALNSAILHDGKEIMPEMCAKLMDKQLLTNKEMELYLRLGGIIPKSMKQQYPQFV